MKGRHHLEDEDMHLKLNIKTDLREILWEGVNWIYLAQDRVLVNTVMNLRVS
jgi:hypothetical protein